MSKEKRIIGRNASIDFIGHAEEIPAKVDTGADSSAVWASNIHITDQEELSFTLFGEESQYYTGEPIVRQNYSAALVRSSNGQAQVRYRTQMTIRVQGQEIRTMFNLSDRSLNAFPVLIGRRTLAHKFIVDVTRSVFEEPSKAGGHGLLNDELRKDPYTFHKKYHGKQSRK